MASTEEWRTLLKAARLYYEDGRTQEEIAAVLKVSRPQVSRLLKQARDRGIVHIQVLDPTATHGDLARSLVDVFGLAQAIVVTQAGQAEELLRARLGSAAARYLEGSLGHGDVVGVGSGRTLHATAAALRPSRTIRASFVPLVGGLQQCPAFFQANELARTLAEKFRAEWLPLYTPAVLGDRQARDAVLTSSPVSDVIQTWEALTVAVVGIGNLQPRHGTKTLFASYLDPATQSRLLDEGAVGGICLRYFTVEGGPCHELAGRVVGLDLDRLRQVPRVIVVAGGADKIEAILGALRGGYIKTLVTDEDAAREILALAEAARFEHA